MPTLQFGIGVSAGGVSIQQNLAVTADHPNSYEVDVYAGIAGSLTTRTDNDTGVVTVATGHGITTSHLVDLYTSAGVLIRQDMTVTATTGTTISIDAGSGSNLPTVLDPVIVSRQVIVNANIDGDAIQFAAVCLEIPGTQTSKGRAIFEDAAADDIAELTLTANAPLTYNVAGGQTNPFTGDPITGCRASNGNATAAKLKIISMEDATP